MTHRTPPPLRDDKLHRMLATRAAPTVAKVRDIRRSLIGPVPTGTANRSIPGLTRTQFPSMVRDAAMEEVVLKGGENISKIGGVVLVGALKGARIVSLALEERATCPRSCAIWDACYGNNMPRLQRYNPGPALEAKIAMEIISLCERHDKVLVRLHILGDFYSLGYLRHWAKLLDHFPGLHVFGFTAWAEDTPSARPSPRCARPNRSALRSARLAARESGAASPCRSPRTAR